MLNSPDRLAIIGLGNTLRRDDGIGIHVLALLQEKLKNQNISLLNFGIASYGLVNDINNFNKVLLIDAIDADLKPATLRIFKLDEASYQTREKKVSSHELSLGDLLNLYKALGISSEVQIAGIQVKMSPLIAKILLSHKTLNIAPFLQLEKTEICCGIFLTEASTLVL